MPTRTLPPCNRLNWSTRSFPRHFPKMWSPNWIFLNCQRLSAQGGGIMTFECPARSPTEARTCSKRARPTDIKPMKELLTKKFWRDVKKTFDDARAEPPDNGDSQDTSPSEAKPKGSQTTPAQKQRAD